MIKYCVLALFVFFGLLACHSQEEKAQVEKFDANSEKIEAQVDLAKYGMEENEYTSLGGLELGASAPQFEKPDYQGVDVSLKNLLKSGPVVLMFYRGYWCPKCDKFLSDFSDHLPAFTEKNIHVIAITPETNENIAKTVESSQFEAIVISDTDMSLMKEYKVLFKVTDAYDDKIKKFLNTDIALTNGNDEAYLPVPATYLIDQSGNIVFRHYDLDYGIRASVEEIMNVL